MVFSAVGLKRGADFHHFWFEIGYVFQSGLALGILLRRNYFLFDIHIGKFLAFLDCLRKSGFYLGFIVWARSPEWPSFLGGSGGIHIL